MWQFASAHAIPLRRMQAAEAAVFTSRTFATKPKAIVSVCLDGTDTMYLHAASAAGKIPFLSGLMSKPGKHYVETYGAMPSFTNPNNAGILTGGPPAYHGICGNYTYDVASGREVSTGASKPLRAPSLLALASAQHGWGTVVVTAKDKLLRMLSTGLPSPSSSPHTRQISLEAVAADASRGGGGGGAGGPAIAALREAGMTPPYPTIYDPHHSTAVLQAGEALITSLLSKPSVPGVLAYLSTTDFVQHKARPDHPLALETLRQFDEVLGRMAGKGWAVTITADHGMNAKHDSVHGTPQVAWLSSALRQAGIPARVILPITDAHVTHHGALGGYAEVWLGPHAQAGTPISPQDRPVSPASLEQSIAVLRALPGVRAVHTAQEAARMYALPIEQVADLTVVSEETWVLGRSPSEHDLSSVLPPLHPPLRSHGSTLDARTPFLCSWEYEEGRAGVAPGLLRNWHALSTPLLAHGLLSPHQVHAYQPQVHPDAWVPPCGG